MLGDLQPVAFSSSWGFHSNQGWIDFSKIRTSKFWLESAISAMWLAKTRIWIKDVSIFKPPPRSWLQFFLLMFSIHYKKIYFVWFLLTEHGMSECYYLLCCVTLLIKKIFIESFVCSGANISSSLCSCMLNIEFKFTSDGTKKITSNKFINWSKYKYEEKILGKR